MDTTAYACACVNRMRKTAPKGWPSVPGAPAGPVPGYETASLCVVIEPRPEPALRSSGTGPVTASCFETTARSRSGVRPADDQATGAGLRTRVPRVGGPARRRSIVFILVPYGQAMNLRWTRACRPRQNRACTTREDLSLGDRAAVKFFEFQAGGRIFLRLQGDCTRIARGRQRSWRRSADRRRPRRADPRRPGGGWSAAGLRLMEVWESPDIDGHSALRSSTWTHSTHNA